jgi:PleD family two-component response regulator
MGNQVKKRVLIVDDMKSNLLILYSILKEDYTLLMARNGLEAIERASKYAPDLILLDILMPEMCGYDVITALKSSDKTQNIPVIFISGLDGPGDEEKGLSLGAVDYIKKPFNPAIVKLRVQNQIESLY